MTTKLEPIRLAVETPAEPDEAWDALTDPDRIAEWFTEASPLGRPGDAYRLDFGDSLVEGEIVSLDPGRSFAHTWTWQGDETAEPTLVTWTVEARPGGGTVIILEHGGWTEAGLDDAVREDHRGYWAAYLEELEALLAD
jgi:uncharacterized protein YndB with AHSA1/START domain